jgi:hypothetical protein
MAEKSKVKSQRSKVKAIWSLWLVACGLSLCLSLLLMACEKTQSELFQPRLVIHGQIQLGNTDSLYVQVNRTYLIDELYNWGFGDPGILVSHGSDTTRPFGRDRSEHNLFQPRLNVNPGDTFDIVVTEPGFDTVRGRTVVPDTFRFLYPRNGDTVTLADSLGWTRSRMAAGYCFTVLSIDNEDSTYYDVVVGNDSTGPDYDSTKVHFPGMFFYYGTAPGWETLVVYALDTNYYDWMRLVGFGPGGGTPPETTHLTGGLGVFGAAAVETLSFYWTADTTFRRQPHCPTGALEAKSEVGAGRKGWRGQRNEWRARRMERGARFTVYGSRGGAD